MIDRQTLGNLVPLAAVVIALAEYLLDHTVPRYSEPVVLDRAGRDVGLLVMVQVLRFTGARRPSAAKPDYSATTLIRRRSDPEDRG